MKKVTVLFVVLIGLCVSFLSCKKEATDVSNYTGSGHPEWPPIMYKQGNDIAGAGPELVKKIFGEMGLNIEVQYKGPWEDVLKKTEDGEVHLLVGAYYTQDRDKYMAYSKSYCDDPVSLFVKKGQTFPFANWDELIGKTGVVLIGDSYGEDFDNFLAAKLKVVKASTVAEAYNFLLKEDIDYFVYSYYSGNRFIKQNNLDNKFEVILKPVSVEKFYITISRKSPLMKYLPDINRILQRYEDDGTTVAIINKYLFIK